MAAAALWGHNATAQQDLYDVDTIQKIEVFFSQPNWDYMMDTARAGLDGYTVATQVKINGIAFDSVGVKYKGNSSYSASRTKNPLTISLNEYKSNKYQTYKTLKLSNVYQDPSMIREVLSYNILAKYMHCPRANFAQVYINGASYGIYSNIENINKQFCTNRFNNDGDNTLIKCNPTTVAPSLKSNLKFIDDDSTKYYTRYEIKSDYGWGDLVALTDSITTNPTSINRIFNADRVLWMLAFDNVLVNLDSYIGLYSQNYFVSKDNNGRFNPIIWDMNMSFGGFINAGLGASGDNILNTQPKLSQLTPLIHEKDVNWPLIKAVMADTTLRKQYFAHMSTIISENFKNAAFEDLASKLQATIDTAVASDTTKAFTYDNFKNGMVDSVKGNYYIYGIKSLMDARLGYLSSFPELTSTTPVISSVLTSETKDSVTFLASVTNSISVVLGIRTNTYDAFAKYQMFDDGKHDDGSAGDGLYGVLLPLTMKKAQYYVVAENDNAAIFSPARAEHEFFTYTSSIPTPVAGQLVINEFVASNTAGLMSELGKYDDWIELYNTTANQLSLNGLYLTDDTANLDKYQFPENAIIPAHGYILVWADEHSSSTTGYHTNFKLSTIGETITLSDGESSILDSITFGEQLDNVSMGRCANATGSFVKLGNPSPASSNDCSSEITTSSKVVDEKIYAFPAPSDQYVTITLPPNTSSAKIIDALGRVLFTVSSSCTIDTSSWDEGIYNITSNDSTAKLVIQHHQ